MKKILCILLLNFLFADFAMADVIQSPTKQKGLSVSTEKNKFPELNLTKEQKDFLNFIEKESRSELGAVASKLKRKNMELEALILSDANFDNFSVESKLILQETSKLCQNAAAIRKKTEEKIIAILDDKQKEIYKKNYLKKTDNIGVSGAAANVDEFKYDSCKHDSGVAACKIEDLLKSNDKKSN